MGKKTRAIGIAHATQFFLKIAGVASYTDWD
jgi:hypothetical protein